MSDFGILEVASALGRRVRAGEIAAGSASEGLADLRTWISMHADEAKLRSDDLAFAEAALARFELTLRAPDALHIAIAHRLGATLATFDRKQAASARQLGALVSDVGR